MSHAEICPVCHGTGRTSIGGTLSTKEDYTVGCRGCQGTGWVTVDDGPAHRDSPVWASRPLDDEMLVGHFGEVR